MWSGPVREEESLPQVSDEIRETLEAYESAERMGGDGSALGVGLGGARLVAGRWTSRVWRPPSTCSSCCSRAA